MTPFRRLFNAVLVRPQFQQTNLYANSIKVKAGAFDITNHACILVDSLVVGGGDFVGNNRARYRSTAMSGSTLVRSDARPISYTSMATGSRPVARSSPNGGVVFEPMTLSNVIDPGKLSIFTLRFSARQRVIRYSEISPPTRSACQRVLEPGCRQTHTVRAFQADGGVLQFVSSTLDVTGTCSSRDGRLAGTRPGVPWSFRAARRNFFAAGRRVASEYRKNGSGYMQIIGSA